MSGDFHIEGVEEFLASINLADAAVQRGLKRGMGKAVNALLADCVMQVPMVPLDLGTLRGSGSAFVGRELAGTGPPAAEPGASPTPETTSPPFPSVLSGAVVGQVGFNTPYAAHLHEHPEYEFGHTREKRGRPPVTGTGGKYLETPMVSNRKKYLGIIAKDIKKELNNGKTG